MDTGSAQSGEGGQALRDRMDAAAQFSVFDPIALEDRLRVARQQRAEAIARREAAGRSHPAPVARPPATAPPPVEPAAPVLAAPPAPRRAAPAAARRRASAPSVAHPLVAVLAVGLSAAFALSRGAPEAAPTDAFTAVEAAPPADAASVPAPTPVDVASATPPAQPTVTVARPTPAPAETPEPAVAVAARSDPAAVAPRPASAPPPDPAAVPAIASRPVARAPAVAEPDAEPEALAPPTPVAPRAARVLVNAPASVPPGALDATLATLGAAGFDKVANQPTRLTIRTSTVRYYNAEDAAAAAEIAALIGPELPGGIEARDFSTAPSRGAPGHLEIWIAGASPGGPARAARPAPASGIDPDQIRRLVESALTPPSVEELNRSANELARDVETGASRIVRRVDAAMTDAVRMLEGR